MKLPVPCAIGMCLATSLAFAQQKLMPTRIGHWSFENSLADSSGRGNHAQLEGVQYASGFQGKGLRCSPTEAVTVPHSPELCLFPGLKIECDLYFEATPRNYATIVTKHDEYQLRIDHPKEGGRLSFFVNINGWEPRIGSIVPKAKTWYHVVAVWDGSEIRLEVNGNVSKAYRAGSAVPTENPVVIGSIPGIMDEITIDNPRIVDREWALGLASEPAPLKIAGKLRFGKENGWAGWEGRRGGNVNIVGSDLEFFPESDQSVLVCNGLDLDITSRPHILIDGKGYAGETANLLFVTERGYGVVQLQLWESGRTVVATMAHHPFWRGKLKLLALLFPGQPPSQPVRLTRISLSREEEAKPYLYFRELAPGRAILRTSRAEEVIAVLRNLGGTAENSSLRVELPRGLRLLQESSTQSVGDLAFDATVSRRWKLRAETPGTYLVRVVADVAGERAAESAIDLEFRLPVALPQASYVPRPRPAKADRTVLMHYCPLWKMGTHYGWNKIEPWPSRKPAIGFYDEGTPEVADWHIKYALEHGIQGFIYCWYRETLEPTITEHLGHAIHDGLLHAKYLDMFNFTIMWENGCAKGVKDLDDLMDNVFPYWMKHFFSNPSYLKVDNKPVLFVWRPERVAPQLGGTEGTREAFELMREACRKVGFDGLWIIGCVGSADRPLLERMAAEGWDASSAYAVWGNRDQTLERDKEGLPSIDHSYFVSSQQQVWQEKRAINALPDITAVMMGWDKRPWHGKRINFYTRDVSINQFEKTLAAGKAFADSAPGNGVDKQLFVLDNWNEFGEGHYLEPCAGFGFGFVDAIRRVFCPGEEPCVDILPEDVGLEPPDHVYRGYRAVMFGEDVQTNRMVKDNLVCWWRFDDDNDHFAVDSSACGFRGMKMKYQRDKGVSGAGFRCEGGTVALDAHRLFFPLTGITVGMWVKTDVPKQTDHWMLNTVARADTGYRLGLSNGRPTWQIPQTAWSHGLTAPDELPVNRWVHLAATFDNETMRLYVDGVEVAKMDREGLIAPGTRDLVMGSFSPGMGRAAFQGMMDEVRIWDRALTPGEIARLQTAP